MKPMRRHCWVPLLLSVTACGGQVDRAADPLTAQADPCRPHRFDLLRYAAACELPPASAAGRWQIDPLFPDAPAEVRARFCAYTWTPAACAAAPADAVPHADGEKLVDRGGCLISSAGCAPTRTRAGLPPPPAAPAPEQCAGGVCAVSLASTGVGCCDACGRIQDQVAYIVLDDNKRYDQIWFDAPAAGGQTRRITVYAPASNVIGVALEPGAGDGVIPSVHMQ
jgi:hypothetical protein